jgi:hypothetical protein
VDTNFNNQETKDLILQIWTIEVDGAPLALVGEEEEEESLVILEEE